MYSHGASARIGGAGKRGHGGRNYRPPPERRKEGGGPPPLKECSCLLQCHIPEYLQREPEQQPRRHVVFGGRRGVEFCEKMVRSRYQAHLVVPGKRQAGPVAIAAATMHQAVPAMAWMLRQIIIMTRAAAAASTTQDSSSGSATAAEPLQFRGHVQTNVKRLQDPGVSGTWHMDWVAESSLAGPFFLFRCDEGADAIHWGILACNLPSRRSGSEVTATSPRSSPEASDVNDETNDVTALLERLKVCMENASFRMGGGAAAGLDVFFDTGDTETSVVFAAGSMEQAELLRQEALNEFHSV